MLDKFLQRVLPASGTWLIVHIGGNGGAKTSTVESGDVSKVTRLVTQGNNNKENTYYGVCSFVAPQGGVLKRNRECAVLGKFRTLRLDIDVGDGKNYQTFDDAVEATDGFVDAIGLPPPLLVSSGRGLHVYFPFVEDIDFATWHGLADALRNAALGHGLRFDDNVTEAERLLRLPTSINQRNGQTAYIYDEGAEDTTVASLSSVLDAYKGSSQMLPAMPSYIKADTSELEQGLYQPYSAALAIENCPALAKIAGTRGGDVSEPLWKRIIDLIVGGNDSKEVKGQLFMAVSDGYPSFSVGELTAKVQQSVKQNYPPPTCQGINRPECATCQFKTRVTAPATLGVAGFAAPTFIVAPPVAMPLPVKGVQDMAYIGRVDLTTRDALRIGAFTLKSGYLYCKKKVGEEFVDQQVAPNYRFVSAVILTHKGDGYNGMSVDVVCLDASTREKRSTHTLNLPTEAFYDTKIFWKCFQQAGVFVPTATDKSKMGEFFMGFISFLQASGAQLTKHSHLGWSEDGSFILGDVAVNVDGSYTPHETPVGLLLPNGGIPVYGVKGDEGTQVAAINSMLVTNAAHLLIALSIATPLVRFTAFNGAIVSMYSKQSGIGKTALLTALTSVWGNPAGSFIAPKSSTVAIQHLMGVGRSLPIAIDEVSMVEDQTIADLLYDVSQGKGKRRMESGGGAMQKQQTEWQTLLFVTTNKTLADRARVLAGDSDAILARLLEITMPPLPKEITMGNPDKTLEQNYGHVGRRVAALYMKHSEDDWRRIIADRVQSIAGAMGLKAVHGPDRFRIALCAIAELGAIAGNQIGIKLDGGAISTAVQAVCTEMNQESKSLTVDNEEILRMFITDNQVKFGKLVQHEGIFTVLNPPNADTSCGEMRFTRDSAGTGFTLATFHVVLYKLLAWVKAKKYDETDFRRWVLSTDATTTAIGEYNFMAHTIHSHRSPAVKIDLRLLGVASLSQVPPAPIDKAVKKS